MMLACPSLLLRRAPFNLPLRTLSPYQMPNMLAWFDAGTPESVLNSVAPDVPATDGQTVRRWLDLSGNNYHLNQATGAYQPVLEVTGLNGRRAIRNPGSNTCAMESVSFAPAFPFTAYHVGQVVSWSDSGRFVTLGLGARQVCRQRNSNNLQTNFGLELTNTAAVGLKTHAFAAVVTGAATSRVVVGGQVVTGNTGSTAADRIIVFSAAGAFTNGRLCELLLFAGEHPSSTISAVLAFLRSKWGTEL